GEAERIEARGGHRGVGVGDDAAHHLVARDDELDDRRAHRYRCLTHTAAQVSPQAHTPAKTSSSTTPAPFFQRGSRSKNLAGQGLSTSQMRKRTNPASAAKRLRGRNDMVTR